MFYWEYNIFNNELCLFTGETSILPDIAQPATPANNLEEQELTKFLERFGLLDLHDRLKNNGVVLQDLIEYTKGDLAAAGVSEIGYQSRILRAAQTLKNERGTTAIFCKKHHIGQIFIHNIYMYSFDIFRCCCRFEAGPFNFEENCGCGTS